MDEERACGDSMPIEDEDLVTLFLRWGNNLWERVMSLLRWNRRRRRRRFGIRLMNSIRGIPDEVPPIEEPVPSSSSSDACSSTNSAIAGSEPPELEEVSLDVNDIEVLYSNTMMAQEDVGSILYSDNGDGDASLSLLEADNVSVDIDLYEPQPGPSMPSSDISQPREYEGLHSGDEERIAPIPSPPVVNRELRNTEAAGEESTAAEESGRNVEEQNPQSNENQEDSNGGETCNKSKDV